jgi:hypothetical protein
MSEEFKPGDKVILTAEREVDDDREISILGRYLNVDDLAEKAEAFPGHTTLTHKPQRIMSPAELSNGDKVRVTLELAVHQHGVLFAGGLSHSLRNIMDSGGIVELIERGTPPEPEWQVGDIAHDERGLRWIYHPVMGEHAAWRLLAGESRRSRDEIPGRLTRLKLVPEDAE